MSFLWGLKAGKIYANCLRIKIMEENPKGRRNNKSLFSLTKNNLIIQVPFIKKRKEGYEKVRKKLLVIISILVLLVLLIYTGANAELQPANMNVTVTPDAVYPRDSIVISYSVYALTYGAVIYPWDVNRNTKVTGAAEQLITQTNGQINIAAPQDPGLYTFRLSAVGSTEFLADSNVFTVIQPVTTVPNPVPPPAPVLKPEAQPKPVEKKEGLKYEFDEVEVVFAAEFTAKPVSAEANNWFTDIAGGPDKPLHILYGKVKLKSFKNPGFISEEFIKISGANGSERLLHNSTTTGWYGDSTNRKLKYLKSLLWSAKRLDGTTIVKDFTPPIKSVTFKKNFDEAQNLISIDLFFATEYESGKPHTEFRSPVDPTINSYRADMTSLVYNGDPKATNE